VGWYIDRCIEYTAYLAFHSTCCFMCLAHLMGGERSLYEGVCIIFSIHKSRQCPVPHSTIAHDQFSPVVAQIAPASSQVPSPRSQPTHTTTSKCLSTPTYCAPPRGLTCIWRALSGLSRYLSSH
jgi:hypothetical protein